MIFIVCCDLLVNYFLKFSQKIWQNKTKRLQKKKGICEKPWKSCISPSKNLWPAGNRTNWEINRQHSRWSYTICHKCQIFVEIQMHRRPLCKKRTTNWKRWKFWSLTRQRHTCKYFSYFPEQSARLTNTLQNSFPLSAQMRMAWIVFLFARISKRIDSNFSVQSMILWLNDYRLVDATVLIIQPKTFQRACSLL